MKVTTAEEQRLELVHKLADQAVESASQKDLTRLYHDDAFNYYNDLEVVELLEVADYGGLLGEIK
jgi:hypothetical protein